MKENDSFFIFLVVLLILFSIVSIKQGREEEINKLKSSALSYKDKINSHYKEDFDIKDKEKIDDNNIKEDKEDLYNQTLSTKDQNHKLRFYLSNEDYKDKLYLVLSNNSNKNINFKKTSSIKYKLVDLNNNVLLQNEIKGSKSKLSVGEMELFSINLENFIKPGNNKYKIIVNVHGIDDPLHLNLPIYGEFINRKPEVIINNKQEDKNIDKPKEDNKEKEEIEEVPEEKPEEETIEEETIDDENENKEESEENIEELEEERLLDKYLHKSLDFREIEESINVNNKDNKIYFYPNKHNLNNKQVIPLLITMDLKTFRLDQEVHKFDNPMDLVESQIILVKKEKLKETIDLIEKDLNFVKTIKKNKRYVHTKDLIKA